MKATFFERLGAYFIDLIIISFIASIISSVVPTKDSTISTNITNLTNSYIKNEITVDAYLDGYKDLLYENTQNSKPDSIVSLVITIAYFIIFQYMNKGKTIGKLALGLKIVEKDSEKEPSIMKMIIRNIIPFGIFTSIINLITISAFSKQDYFNVYYITSTIESLFIISSLASIIIRNDNRGLHDLIANTKVIKEERR